MLRPSLKVRFVPTSPIDGLVWRFEQSKREIFYVQKTVSKKREMRIFLRIMTNDKAQDKTDARSGCNAAKVVIMRSFGRSFSIQRWCCSLEFTEWFTKERVSFTIWFTNTRECVYVYYCSTYTERSRPLGLFGGSHGLCDRFSANS